MFGLDHFDFQSLWSPWFMILMMLIIGLYFAMIGPLRHRFSGSAPVGIGKQSLFVTGIILYYIAQGSPLYLLGHLMFSAHMVSMSLAYLIVPPLILLGLPVWFLRSLINLPAIKKMITFLTHPIFTLLLFNMLFSFYHFPMVFDYIMTHYFIHAVYFMALLAAAFLMWWTIVCPVPEMDRLSELKKMGFIFANGVLLTPACALIIFANTTLYGTFSDPHTWADALGYCVPANTAFLIERFSGPEFFALVPPLEDQQLGGVIMKLIQEFVYGTILFFIFYKWYRRENPQDAVDPMPRERLTVLPSIR
ncbi:MAG TPA: cytochrome c oxidase assembly factor CtaG [Bacilli bacterium]